jgi:serine/threonine protein kinase
MPTGVAKQRLDFHRLESLAEVYCQEVKRRKPELQTSFRDMVDTFLSRVQSGNVITLAILLYSRCGYNELRKFDKAMRRTKCIDDTLPLSQEGSHALCGEALATLFCDNQYIFIPVQLQEGKHYRKEDMSLRIPIIKRTRIGGGISGTVYNSVIAPGGWRDAGGCVNDIQKEVAQKVYLGQSKKECLDERQEEFDIISRVQGSSKKHNNVAHCWGCLDDDTEASLFFEKADLSLEELLTSEGKCKVPLKSLLCSLAGLGKGLHFLHHELDVDGVTLRVYHRDFSPDNILIYENGSWKVADFGRSKIKEMEGKSLDGKMLRSPRRPEKPEADGSPFQAPDGGVGTASEVFSYSAIITVVLTYWLGGREMVEAFAKEREGSQQIDKFWCDSPEGIILNPKVEDFLTQLRQGSKVLGPEFGNAVSHILEHLMSGGLAIDSDGRPTAGDIATVLYTIARDLPVSEPLEEAPEEPTFLEPQAEESTIELVTSIVTPLQSSPQQGRQRMQDRFRNWYASHGSTWQGRLLTVRRSLWKRVRSWCRKYLRRS